MTNPTHLSPAAQAVLTAATQRLYCLDPEDVPRSASEHGSAIAAALRAAAHEVAPFPGRYPMNEYMEGFRDAKQSVHHQLTAIAAELDGTSALEPNDLSHLSEEEFQALAPQGYHAP